MKWQSLFFNLAGGRKINRLAAELSGPAAVDELLGICGYRGRPEGLAARLEMELPAALPLHTGQGHLRVWGSFFPGPRLMQTARALATAFPPQPGPKGPAPSSSLGPSRRQQFDQAPWNTGRVVLELARAWLIGGEPDLLSGVERQFRQYHLFSPPLLGPGWVEPEVVAARAVNWLLALRLVGHIGRMDAEVTAQAVVDLRVAGAMLASVLEQQAAPRLEQLGPAVALIFLGRALGLLPEAPEWAETGAARAAAALACWDTPGVGRASSVAAVACQWAALAVWLAGRSEALDQGLESTAAACRALAAPWGRGNGWGWHPLASVVALGPDAGGRAFAWPANLAAILLQKPELRADRQVDEPLFWLRGSQAAEELRALAHIRPPKPAEAPGLGLGWLCAEAGGRRAAVVLRTSPQDGRAGANRQAEALSLGLCLDGKPVLITPGPNLGGAMGGHIGGRAAFNAPRVDGSEPLRGRVRPEAWQQTAEHGFISAVYDGYARLVDPVHLRRRVHMDAARGMLNIVDQIDAKAEHEVSLHFMLPPDCRVNPGGAGIWLVEGDAGRVLIRPEPLARCRVVRGQAEPPLGWSCDASGKLVPSPVLVISCTVRGEAALTTSFVWGAG